MKFILILLIVTIISYGQLLGMHVWQDDNGLFFKLAHIEERAGYLNAGPFGSGAYKYIATPYIPIYEIFGFNTIPYFVLTLAFYFVSTLFVYKVFSEILDKKAGRVAGFLYAAGYLAADGFIRLFNSVITSVSVILISLLILYLWRYTKTAKIKWYFFSVMVFWAALEFARARTHYLVAVVILYELVFNAFKKPIKSIFYSVARLIPYSLIFYYYFVVGADQRSGQVKVWISNIFSGNLDETYSFTSSLSNIIFPNWISDFLFKLEEVSGSLLGTHIPIIKLLGVLVVGITSFTVFKRVKKGKIITLFLTSLVVIWSFVSENIYTTVRLNLGYKELSLTFLGGVALALLIIIFFKIKEYKKLYILFGFWTLVNLAAYSAYNPSVLYESINRYIAHSFFALIGVLVVIYLNFYKERKFKKIVYFLIIFWGTGNLLANVFYQNKILRSRAAPARNFYKQLKGFVPETNKEDVFYFDVDNTARGYFNDAFSVASMPETTAIAWRYGLDRYDIKLFTNFEELEREVDSGNTDTDQLHSFWYKDLKLSDTSEILRDYFKGGRRGRDLSFSKSASDSEIEINFSGDIVGATPVELSIKLLASPREFSESDFPTGKNSGISRINAFDYKLSKENILNSTKYEVSSQWRERTIERLHDGDTTTYWQADRVLFRNKNENFSIDLGRVESINRFVFINGFANNSPTDYSIEVSRNGVNWKEVKRVQEARRIETTNFEVISFDTVAARFVRMVIRQTLNSDSPAISEAWPILSRFSELDINETEVFLKNPFAYLPSLGDYRQILLLSGYRGSAQVYWMKDNSGRWETSEKSKLEILYDGSGHFYTLMIPPGGLKLTGIKFRNFIIPGEVKVFSIQEQ